MTRNTEPQAASRSQRLRRRIYRIPRLTRSVLNRLLRFLTRHLIRFEIIGKENIPRQGPLIVYINHVNFLDPVLACALVPRDVVPLSKVENLRHPLIGPLAKAYGAIPVRRGEPDMYAYRSALSVLEQGKALLIAPEGTRSGHGRLQEGKDGMTLLALRTGAVLVPIGLVGQQHFRRRLQRLRRTHVRAAVGRPFRFHAPAGVEITREVVREMTREAMGELARLLPAEWRGVYADSAEAPRRWIRYEDTPTTST